MTTTSQIKNLKFLAWWDCATTSQKVGNYQLALYYCDRALQYLPNHHSFSLTKARLLSELASYVK